MNNEPVRTTAHRLIVVGSPFMATCYPTNQKLTFTPTIALVSL